jgi:hypothetical protein
VTEFLQYVVAGMALGARYALVALGFVVIYKATGVINFAQGSFVPWVRTSPTTRTSRGACRSPSRWSSP